MNDANVAKKIDGKWKTFGQIKKNNYGNYQLSFKVTDELLKEFQIGGWANFALFDKEEAPARVETPPLVPTQHGLDDEIPF